MKSLAVSMIVLLPLVFVVAAAATYVYSGLVHKAAAVDWATAIRLALILALGLSLGRAIGQRRKPAQG